jgi:glyoxylase-like metal-dependent hydrolase (beta-lactamase superfamily II)
MIVKQMEVGGLAVFCYIVGCPTTKQAALIDPAGDAEPILAETKSLGLTIHYLINTHAHPDHISGNADIVGATGAKIVIHEAEASWLTSLAGKAFLAMFGGKQSPKADITVADDDVIAVGDEKLKVIHTPGHSPGSICLYDGVKHLFTGDTLFVGGVGRTDLPGGSMKTMMKSIQERILTLPDDTIILPGHNYGPTPTSTVKIERENNPFVNS